MSRTELWCQMCSDLKADSEGIFCTRCENKIKRNKYEIKKLLEKWGLK